MKNKRIMPKDEYEKRKARFRDDPALHKLSSDKIAAELGIPVQLARAWARNFGINLPGVVTVQEVDRKKQEMLDSEYIVDGCATMNMTELGKIFGLNRATVSRVFHAAGIRPFLQSACSTFKKDERIPLPKEARFLAKQLENWKRNKELDDIVWPLIQARRWHESTHREG